MKFGPISKARVLTIILAFITSLAVTFAGTSSPMSTSEAQVISEEAKKMLPHMMNVPAIFRNNLMYALLMFIPIVGPLSAFYVLHSTGRLLAALAIANGSHPAALFVVTFLFPHAWVEYMAYALVLSQSLWLTLRIVQRRSLKAEAINTCIFIAVCAILLLLGAVIEVATIQLLELRSFYLILTLYLMF